MKIRTYATGSSGNLYTVEAENGYVLMLECGIPMSRIKSLIGADMVRVEAALVTHEHGDHAKAASALVSRGVMLFATAGTIDALGLTGRALTVPVKPLERMHIGPFEIMPFPVDHDAAEPVGFLIREGNEKLCFITDARICRYRFSGCTEMYVECNWCEDLLEASDAPARLKDRVRHSHMSLDACKRFLMACDLSACKKITLIHTSAFRGDTERFRREIERTTGRRTETAHGEACKEWH